MSLVRLRRGLFGGGITASTPPRMYLRIRYSSTTPSAAYTVVSAINEVQHLARRHAGETACAVNIHTPSTPLGLGATTNG